MPFPEILESDFEHKLVEFVWHPVHLDELQLESALELQERLRPQEDKLFRILWASHFMTEEHYAPAFITEIQSELQRRVAFITNMKQKIGENFEERLGWIRDQKAETRERKDAGCP